MTKHTCPLTLDWPARLRPVAFRFADPAQEALLKAAHCSRLDQVLAELEPVWQAAPVPNAPALRGAVFAGFPCHIHTDLSVDGWRVHIDRTWANLHSPGRLKTEVHIFVDGALAGFGGSVGCSLGFTSSIEPAVALLGDGRAVVVSRRYGRRGIGLADVLAAPDVVTLHTVDSTAPAVARASCGEGVVEIMAVDNEA